MTKLEFIDMIGSVATKVATERGLGNVQIWTCIAQACCESGFGTSKLMSNANAFFGIKATQSWVNKAKYGGKVYNASTKECYDGSTYTTINACFRAYNNMEDSVRDYFDLMTLPRYKDSLTKDNVVDCITTIKNGGYATSPTYIQTITNIYNQYKSEIEKWNTNMTTSKRTVKEILHDITTLLNELEDVL